MNIAFIHSWRSEIPTTVPRDLTSPGVGCANLLKKLCQNLRRTLENRPEWRSWQRLSVC